MASPGTPIRPRSTPNAAPRPSSSPPAGGTTISWRPWRTPLRRGPRNLERHLARLADSADYFGYPCDLTGVRQQVESTLSGRGEAARVRIRLSRTGSVAVDLAAPPAVPEGPVRLAVDAEPVDSTSVWLAHKTSRRDVYELRAGRHPAADDVLLVNERGEVTESTVANVAVRIDRRWWTPPVSSGCLPGVERGRLLADGVLHERVLVPADLHGAEDLALVSSLRGWRAAVLAPQAAG